MKIKKMFVIVMIILIAFTASACTEIKKVAEPVNIHILLNFPDTGEKSIQDRRQLYLDTAEKFHELNPNITVTIDQVTGDTILVQDFITRLESDEAPDISPYLTNNLQKAEADGLLLDLMHFLKSSDSKEEDINQSILDSVTINGKLFVLPYSAIPMVVLYNKDFFDAANIPYPQGDWTFEQFRSISKQLKPTRGSEISFDPWTFDLLMSSTGKSMLSPQGDTSIGYLDSPEAIGTMQWLNAYYRDDKEKKSPTSWNDANHQFEIFQTGMIVQYFSDYDWMTNKFGDKRDKVGIAPLPHFEGKKRANLISLDGFGISSKSKHPQEAWEFLEYLTLTNQENTKKLTSYYLSTSKSISESTGQNLDPIKSIAIDEMNYQVASSDFYNPHFFKAWNEKLTSQFQKLLKTDDQDIPSALHDLALKLDQELNRLKHENEQQTESASP